MQTEKHKSENGDFWTFFFMALPVITLGISTENRFFLGIGVVFLILAFSETRGKRQED